MDSGKGYGVATPPGSDLRDRLNLAVLELKEMDWIAQLYRLWWEERGECGKMAKSADVCSDFIYFLFWLLFFPFFTTSPFIPSELLPTHFSLPFLEGWLFCNVSPQWTDF